MTFFETNATNETKTSFALAIGEFAATWMEEGVLWLVRVGSDSSEG